MTSDYDEGARTIAAVHTDLVQYAVVSLAGLVLLAPLAFAVRRARHAARIAAWTIGITVTVALLITLVGGPDELVSPGGTENQATRAALDNLLPTWYLDATSLLTAAQLAAVVAFCVLLLRTSAADFYRSPRPQGPDGLWRQLAS